MIENLKLSIGYVKFAFRVETLMTKSIPIQKHSQTTNSFTDTNEPYHSHAFKKDKKLAKIDIIYK